MQIAYVMNKLFEINLSKNSLNYWLLFAIFIEINDYLIFNFTKINY